MRRREQPGRHASGQRHGPVAAGLRRCRCRPPPPPPAARPSQIACRSGSRPATRLGSGRPRSERWPGASRCLASVPACSCHAAGARGCRRGPWWARHGMVTWAGDFQLVAWCAMPQNAGCAAHRWPVPRPPTRAACRRSAAAGGHAARRQVTRMMPIGVPRVPYRTPKVRRRSDVRARRAACSCAAGGCLQVPHAACLQASPPPACRTTCRRLAAAAPQPACLHQLPASLRRKRGHAGGCAPRTASHPRHCLLPPATSPVRAAGGVVAVGGYLELPLPRAHHLPVKAGGRGAGQPGAPGHRPLTGRLLRATGAGAGAAACSSCRVDEEPGSRVRLTHACAVQLVPGRAFQRSFVTPDPGCRAAFAPGCRPPRPHRTARPPLTRHSPTPHPAACGHHAVPGL